MDGRTAANWELSAGMLLSLIHILSFGGALPVPYVPANGISESKAASTWDALIQGPGQESVLTWLRMIDPRIEALDYIAGRGTSRIALLKVEGQGRIPLGTMGDGVRRMFHIGLAMASASKGCLLYTSRCV